MTNGFSGFPGFPPAFLAGLPGLSNSGFPGFPFGFPAQGFAGHGDTDINGRGDKKSKVPTFMDTGFMSGGNIDFMKMATLVSSREPKRNLIANKIFLQNNNIRKL